MEKWDWMEGVWEEKKYQDNRTFVFLNTTSSHRLWCECRAQKQRYGIAAYGPCWLHFIFQCVQSKTEEVQKDKLQGLWCFHTLNAHSGGVTRQRLSILFNKRCAMQHNPARKCTPGCPSEHPTDLQGTRKHHTHTAMCAHLTDCRELKYASHYFLLILSMTSM